MTQPHAPQSLAPNVPLTDEPWQGVFPPRDDTGLSAFTPDELLAELLHRTSDDAASLRQIQSEALGALLRAIDQQAGPGNGAR